MALVPVARLAQQLEVVKALICGAVQWQDVVELTGLTDLLADLAPVALPVA
jgi:hypothetical protein